MSEPIEDLGATWRRLYYGADACGELAAMCLPRGNNWWNRQQQKCIRDEAEVRKMLGMWVSGADPALAYNTCGDLLGLCDAAIPVGSVAPLVIEAWQ